MDLAYRVYKNILLSMWEITLSQLLFFYASLVLFLLVCFYVYRKYIFIVLQPVDFSTSFVLYFLPRYEHWYCSLQQIFQLSFMSFCQFRWRHVHMYCSFQQIFHLSIVLFSQSRWRHMYCSFQHIFHLPIVLFPQSRWRHMYCSFQQIFHLSIVLFPQSRWRHMHCSLQQIFNCLLCCFRNPDEDICTVPSNGYACVYCVVLSIQMKTYALFPLTDIQLSIVLFSQSRWRHMYCSFQRIFQLSIVSFYHSRWRYMYYSLEQIFHLCFASFFFSIKIRTSVLFHSIAFSMIYCVVYSILCFFVYLIVVFVYSSN